MVRRSRHFDPIDVQQLLVAFEVARSGLMVMRRKLPIKGENDYSDQRAMESVLLYAGRGGWTTKSHPLEAFSCQTAFEARQYLKTDIPLSRRRRCGAEAA